MVPIERENRDLGSGSRQDFSVETWELLIIQSPLIAA